MPETHCHKNVQGILCECTTCNLPMVWIYHLLTPEPQPRVTCIYTAPTCSKPNTRFAAEGWWCGMQSPTRCDMPYDWMNLKTSWISCFKDEHLCNKSQAKLRWNGYGSKECWYEWMSACECKVCAWMDDVKVWVHGKYVTVKQARYDM